jgi:hypothetical protein
LAVNHIERIVAGWPEPISTLDDLLPIVADRLSVCLEYIRRDQDVEDIAGRRAAYAPGMFKLLQHEFLRSSSEGLLIEHQAPQAGDRLFLAIVDARGTRSYREFFTSWHEIAHVLTTPDQREFKLRRRTPPWKEIVKDPVESAIDGIAGIIGFYRPLFLPVLARHTAQAGCLTFQAIEAALAEVAQRASFYSGSLAAIRLTEEPTCFARAEFFLKPAEARKVASGQFSLIDTPPVSPKLRLIDVVSNDAARRAGIGLHQNIRVPLNSVIYRIASEQLISEHQAEEDLSWWETSSSGPLPRKRVSVCATRRGPSTYALIRLMPAA